jgi:hypothetical protein
MLFNLIDHQERCKILGNLYRTKEPRKNRVKNVKTRGIKKRTFFINKSLIALQELKDEELIKIDSFIALLLNLSTSNFHGIRCLHVKWPGTKPLQPNGGLPDSKATQVMRLQNHNDRHS